LIHVYVDRATQKTPTPLPDNLRAALRRITLNPS
jgi:acyl-CoA thioesterase FadM